MNTDTNFEKDMAELRRLFEQMTPENQRKARPSLDAIAGLGKCKANRHERRKLASIARKAARR